MTFFLSIPKIQKSMELIAPKTCAKTKDQIRDVSTNCVFRVHNQLQNSQKIYDYYFLIKLIRHVENEFQRYQEASRIRIVINPDLFYLYTAKVCRNYISIYSFFHARRCSLCTVFFLDSFYLEMTLAPFLKNRTPPRNFWPYKF